MRFVRGSIVAAAMLAILPSSFAKVSSIWVGSWACSSEGTEAARQKVNAWIRTSSLFDAVVNIDKVTRTRAAQGNWPQM
jgi:hypothetical protein